MSTRILIIEDESSASKHLQNLLAELSFPCEILGLLSTVKASVKWLRTHPDPDLILMDIHLSDGIAFDILEEVALDCPIIFTTAYDQYALQAFKTTGIDYLLKPIVKERLQAAIAKYFKLRSSGQQEWLRQNQEILYQQPQIRTAVNNYKEQFLLKSGKHFIPVQTKDIAYFYREDLVFARCFDQSKYLLDQSLNQLHSVLNPQQFVRLNRQLLVNVAAIEKLSIYKPGRFLVQLKPTFQQKIRLSQERSSWLRGILG